MSVERSAHAVKHGGSRSRFVFALCGVLIASAVVLGVNVARDVVDYQASDARCAALMTARAALTHRMETGSFGPDLRSERTLIEALSSVRGFDARLDAIARTISRPDASALDWASLVMAGAYARSDAQRRTASARMIRSAAMLGVAVALASSVVLFGVIRTRSAQLRELRAALQEQSQARAQAERERFAIAANAGHEIRTALNGVTGMARLLESEPLSPQARRRLDVLNASADSLLAIVTDVLDFTKNQCGALELRPSAFAPEVMLRAALDAFAPSAEAKTLTLKLDLPGPLPPMLHGDAQRLRQVLCNLLSNALKYTTQGGVTVRAAWLDDLEILRVEVLDTGHGVPRDQRDAIFEQFTQLRTEVYDQSKGTGLGLSLCREMIRAMGGDLGVDDAPGGGARFWFRAPMRPVFALARAEEAPRVFVDPALGEQRVLATRALRSVGAVPVTEPAPCCAAALMTADDIAAHVQAVRAAAPRARIIALGSAAPPWADVAIPGLVDRLRLSAALSAPLASTRAAAGSPQAALAVDDNPVNLMVAQALLERLGYACDTAPDGAAAVSAVERRRTAGGDYAVTLMDLSMPVLDGLAATRQIRALGVTAPILAVTAHVDAGAEARCRQAGMDAMLTKPLREEALREALSRAASDRLAAAAARMADG